ncbi:hypothetical protein HPP92_002304 [Vanilla planifolia]|uniref:Uncharacterized protein n=1 Tax=Vanilla planifolia TaxID=51239 RepID=A0A835S583_VANPL|nr:hypothetical protein HPP92_002304 [Vanilla planifolia]
MEVVVPMQDLHFDSAIATPYISAPSSPTHFSSNPFDLYYDCTTPTTADHDDDDDFVFDFKKGEPPPPLTTAEELFEHGRIRPLKPPPPFHIQNSDFFPNGDGESNKPPRLFPSLQIPSGTRKGSIPLPTTAVAGGREDGGNVRKPISPPPKQAALGSDGRKWWFIDLFLFRSSSEGHTAGDSISSARRRARGTISTHYAERRALAEEKRKQTALPYRQSLFSCLRFPRRSTRPSVGDGIGIHGLHG